MALNTYDSLVFDFGPPWSPKVGDLVVVTDGPFCYGARILEIIPGAARGGGLARVRGTGLDHNTSLTRWGEEWLTCLEDVRPAR